VAHKAHSEGWRTLWTKGAIANPIEPIRDLANKAKIADSRGNQSQRMRRFQRINQKSTNSHQFISVYRVLEHREKFGFSEPMEPIRSIDSEINTPNIWDEFLELHFRIKI
jgi:hypothetical protein